MSATGELYEISLAEHFVSRLVDRQHEIARFHPGERELPEIIRAILQPVARPARLRRPDVHVGSDNGNLTASSSTRPESCASGTSMSNTVSPEI